MKTINEASLKKEIKVLRAIGFATGFPSLAILILALIVIMIFSETGVLAGWVLIALLPGFYCWMAIGFALRAQIKKRWFMILWGSSSPFALGLIGFMGGFICGGLLGGWEQGPLLYFLTGPIGFLIGIIIGVRILISCRYF